MRCAPKQAIDKRPEGRSTGDHNARIGYVSDRGRRVDASFARSAPPSASRSVWRSRATLDPICSNGFGGRHRGGARIVAGRRPRLGHGTAYRQPCAGSYHAERARARCATRQERRHPAAGSHMRAEVAVSCRIWRGQPQGPAAIQPVSWHRPLSIVRAAVATVLLLTASAAIAQDLPTTQLDDHGQTVRQAMLVRSLLRQRSGRRSPGLDPDARATCANGRATRAGGVSRSARHARPPSRRAAGADRAAPRPASPACVR